MMMFHVKASTKCGSSHHNDFEVVDHLGLGIPITCLTRFASSNYQNAAAMTLITIKVVIDGHESTHSVGCIATYALSIIECADVLLNSSSKHPDMTLTAEVLSIMTCTSVDMDFRI